MINSPIDQLAEINAAGTADSTGGADAGALAVAAPLGASDLRLLLSDNVGAISTLCYLTLIGIGMLHEIVLFKLFGVNVLDWMGPTDFLLVPVRDPLVMVAAIVPILAGWLYWKLVVRAQHTVKRLRENSGRTMKLYTMLDHRLASSTKALWVAMLLLWAIAAALWYALHKSKIIRAGGARTIHIEWVDAARGDTSSVVLLGANANYLVLYRPTKDSAQIVPIAQIFRVGVSTRRRR